MTRFREHVCVYIIYLYAARRSLAFFRVSSFNEAVAGGMYIYRRL